MRSNTIMNKAKDTGFWVLIIIGILLTMLLIVGQTFSLIDYELTVSLGLQESVEEVSEVGIVWAKGFAFESYSKNLIVV